MRMRMLVVAGEGDPVAIVSLRPGLGGFYIKLTHPADEPLSAAAEREALEFIKDWLQPVLDAAASGVRMERAMAMTPPGGTVVQ